MAQAIRTRDLPAVKGRKEMFLIDPEQIVVEKGWNPRTDFSGEEELMASIKAEGILENLTVIRKDDQIVLRNGERRLRAVLRLIKEDPDFKLEGGGVPCVVRPASENPVDDLIVALLKNDGKPHIDIEEAHAYKRLKEMGLTYEDIAGRLKRSEGHVRNRLLLVEAAPVVQKAVAKGEINTTQATKIARMHKDDPNAQAEAVKVAKEKAQAKTQAKAQGQTTQTRRTPLEIAIAAASKLNMADLEKLIKKAQSLKMKAQMQAKKNTPEAAAKAAAKAATKKTGK